MALPGRTTPAPGGIDDKYRYSHNGQEKDNEIFIGALSAEYWEYDSRTGRRWNLDPITHDWESPYATFSNNPIVLNDINGLADGTKRKNKSDQPKFGKKHTKKEQRKINRAHRKHERYNNRKERRAERKMNNTALGQLTVNYSPIKFNQIGGNVKIKPQDDFSYLPPGNKKNFGLGQPDESSSIVTANLLLKKHTFGNRSSLNFSLGNSLTSIKGGILNNGLNYGDRPHFGSGYRTIGVNAIMDYYLRVVPGFSLYGSLNLGGGFSLSDFEEGVSTGLIVIPRKGYSGWSTHGTGATSILHIGFNITPKLFKSTYTEIISLNVSAVFVVHSIRISPYTVQTANGPKDYGVSNATFFGQPRIDATLSIDILQRR